MPYQFHVFLSHNSQDKPAVETVAKALQGTYDLKCWLDKWNLVPGDEITPRIRGCHVPNKYILITQTVGAPREAWRFLQGESPY